MGLDMYLYIRKTKSLGRWDDKFEEKAKDFYPDDLKAIGEAHAKRNFLSKTVSFQVGYWRKANEIHSWIVDHLANGKDECQEIYFPVDSMKELVGLCEQVLADNSLAPTLLPTKSGFFFGGTEYDEDYFCDLQSTIDQLKPIIEFMESHTPSADLDLYYDCYYRASW